MLNLFKRVTVSETEEAMVKLIASQSDLIVLNKQAIQEQKEIEDTLKSLVEVQEQQIDYLNKKLKDYESILAVYSQTIDNCKNRILFLEQKQ
jgi:CII-binding regulator of phage lambda lysogenization HflD